MSAVSKSYGVGDTVYVWFSDSLAMESLPQSRVVSSVDVQTSGNVAKVTFTTGESVMDGSTTEQRVFTTQALCAKAIVDAAITRYTAAVALDTGTTSGSSTSGQVATTLIRKN